MSSSIQFSGLSSGLDTASIIASLMEVEKVPQTNLKSRLATVQSQTSALQQLNTSLASLASSAKSFASGSTWSQLTATSSSSAVTVTASSSALATSFGVTVNESATAAQATFTAADLAAASGTVTISGTDGTAKATFQATDSLTSIAAAINAGSATSGLQAQLISQADGGAVLAIVATTTGDTGNFTITHSGGSLGTVTAGRPATITLSNGVVVKSQTNTFDELMPGIDLTIPAGVTTATTPPVTAQISVTADGASRATAMKAFIGQLNDVLSQIAGTTAYGTIAAGQATTGAGALPGDPTLRAVADQIVGTIFPSGNTTLATYGVSIDRDGRFTFDSAAFTKAYAADPAGTQKVFVGAGSFTERLQKVAEAASDPYDGSVSQFIKSQSAEADRYADQIAAWDDRLAAKQVALQQIYTHLETQLSRLQAQQSWLSSQIDSLDGLSGSKK